MQERSMVADNTNALAFGTTRGRWLDGELPVNVQLGPNTVLTGGHAFNRFHASADPALIIGQQCTMDGVHFAIGESGSMHIGDYCYFTNAVLLCEVDIHIGNFVVIGWNTTIADTDFHPIGPAQRIFDARACSPLGAGMARPPALKLPIVIDDDVWIGPSATILKGVHIGAGAMIEAGTLVTRDVPPGARMIGNPAMMMSDVHEVR